MIMPDPVKPITRFNLPMLRGEIRSNEPMRLHTSWRAGGVAKNFYKPADLDDLTTFLSMLPRRELIIMVGLGSNLLIRDGGLAGTIIALHARLNDLKLVQQDKQGGLIYVGAGATCARVARFAARNNLTGAEFLVGIPGTIGGALTMNAGCYGSEIWQIVTQVQVIDRRGQQYERLPQDYQVNYRQVTLRSTVIDPVYEEWFVGGWLRLARGDYATSNRKIKQLLTTRIRSQPLNMPNAGSVFRNPPGDYAARLIESCHLKGLCVGGAMISSKHANFIINTGCASAADIEAIITIIRNTVEKVTGIALKQEVRIIGNTGGYS